MLLSYNKYKNKIKKKSFFTTKTGKALILIVSAIFILIGSLMVGGNYYLSRINHTNLADFGLNSELPSNDPDDSVDPNLPVINDPSAMQFGSGAIVSDANVQNILLIGSDTRGGEKYGRSDSMMLISMNKNTKQIKMVSFLRDLYVKINGLQDNRINASYSYGGPKLLIDTLQNNFRIKIDNYVRVDFASFQKLIDMVGGVQITLNQAEANQVNIYSGSGRVKAGANKLNGAQALTYARIRHIDSDFGRTQRQRNVIASLMGALKGSNIGTLTNVANEMSPLVQTDLSNNQILDLIFNASSFLSNNTSQLTIPADGVYKSVNIRKMAVLVPDIEKNKALLWKFIYNK